MSDILDDPGINFARKTVLVTDKVVEDETLPTPPMDCYSDYSSSIAHHKIDSLENNLGSQILYVSVEIAREIDLQISREVHLDDICITIVEALPLSSTLNLQHRTLIVDQQMFDEMPLLGFATSAAYGINDFCTISSPTVDCFLDSLYVSVKEKVTSVISKCSYILAFDEFWVVVPSFFEVSDEVSHVILIDSIFSDGYRKLDYLFLIPKDQSNYSVWLYRPLLKPPPPTTISKSQNFCRNMHACRPSPKPPPYTQGTHLNKTLWALCSRKCLFVQLPRDLFFWMNAKCLTECKKNLLIISADCEIIWPIMRCLTKCQGSPVQPAYTIHLLRPPPKPPWDNNIYDVDCQWTSYYDHLSCIQLLATLRRTPLPTV